MRKRAAVILGLILCLTIIGCGADQKQEPEETANQLEQTEETKETEEIKETEVKEEENLEKIALNKEYQVETDSGSFGITISGAKRTDWMRNEEGKEVLVLCYEVHNIDYEPEDGSLLMINSSSLIAEDENGNELEAWDSTKSELGFPDFVENAGETKKQEQPYVAPEGTKEIRIVYKRDGIRTAAITLKVEA